MSQGDIALVILPAALDPGVLGSFQKPKSSNLSVEVSNLGNLFALSPLSERRKPSFSRKARALEIQLFRSTTTHQALEIPRE